MEVFRGGQWNHVEDWTEDQWIAFRDAAMDGDSFYDAVADACWPITTEPDWDALDAQCLALFGCSLQAYYDEWAPESFEEFAHSPKREPVAWANTPDDWD